MVARQLTVEGLWSETLVAWREARERAERVAHGTASTEEIGLADIQQQLDAAVGASLAARAVTLELQYELSECVGIASTLAEVRGLVAAGERVIYASDMYLPKQQIQSMLDKVGAPAAELFLSSELGVTKRTGNLFRRVADHFAIPLSEISHVGDHVESDHRVPRRLGVKTRWCKVAYPTLLEAEIFRHLAQSSPLLATTLAGGMRAARLALPPASTPAEFLVRLGTQEAALVHIGFALWLIRRLGELAPHKIAFLARDGYLSAQIFDVLRSTLSTPLPAATYTYASRQSLHLAGLAFPPMEEDLLWMLAPADSLTFDGWLFRFGLSHDDLPESTGTHPRIPAADELFAACKDDCAKLLEWSPFKLLIAQQAAHARELAHEYLSPSLHPGEGTVAMVDIGWNGRMQRSIVGILGTSAARTEAIHGLYMGLLRTPAGNFGSYEAWLFDLRNEARPYCASHFQLFETLFAAPHGTTYGYERDSAGQVVPTLAAQDAMSSIWPELIAFQRVILDISEGIRCTPEDMRAAESAIRALCRRSIATVFRAPSRAHAMAFFGVGFSSDQTSVGKERLLFRLSWLQQYKFLLNKRFKFSGNHWREGQMAIADAPLLPTWHRLRSTLRLLVKRQLGVEDIIRQILWQRRGRA